MSRASSASVYGSKPPVNLGRMPVKRAPRAYGLVSESAPTGWYAGAKNPPRVRTTRPKNGPVTSNRPKRDAATEKALREMAAIAEREAAEDRRRAEREAHRPIMVGDVSLPKIGNID